MEQVDLRLEAVVARVATTLRYLWPTSEVDATFDPHYMHWRIRLMTRFEHHGDWFYTCETFPGWEHYRHEDDLFQHLVQQLPVRHAVELTRAAVDQANKERFTSEKSPTLRSMRPRF